MTLTMLDITDVIERVVCQRGYAASLADELTELLLEGVTRKQIAEALGISREELEHLLEAIRKELSDE